MCVLLLGELIMTNTNPQLIDDLLEINKKLASVLWNTKSRNESPTVLSPKLIWPTIDNNDDTKERVSEKESRVLYCNILNTSNYYYYSVETPTKEKYVQKGQSRTRARMDLTLYKFNDNRFKPVANIEFKAGTHSPENIGWSIEKLVREALPSNWFHTFQNVDSRTLPNLFRAFAGSFKTFSDILNKTQVSILFSICVLRKKIAFLKQFSYDPTKGNLEDFLNDFFRLDYYVKSGQIIVTDRNRWRIISHTPATPLSPEGLDYYNEFIPLWKDNSDFTIVPGSKGYSAKHKQNPRLWVFKNRIQVAPNWCNNLNEVLCQVLYKHFPRITGKASLNFDLPELSWDKIEAFLKEVKAICKQHNC